MRILCLMPVYNHRHETTENALQCFLDQTHTNKYMLIGDDRPAAAQMPEQFFQNGEVVRFSYRFPTLTEKYNAMLAYAHEENIAYDAVAIWDDDDIFLPMHLTAAAYELSRNPEFAWYHPQRTFISMSGDLSITDTANRFWSCCVVRRSLLEQIGGFPVSAWAGFDQECLRAFGAVTKPCFTEKVINYVYRWGDAEENHTSGYMTDGYAGTAWYGKTPYSIGQGLLNPKYDPTTIKTLEELEVRFKDIAGILVKE